jgi:hypothetical protein
MSRDLLPVEAQVNNPDRRHHPVVPARDVFGEILATKLTAKWLI